MNFGNSLHVRRTTTDNDTSYIFVKGDLKIVEQICMGGVGKNV